MERNLWRLRLLAMSRRGFSAVLLVLLVAGCQSASPASPPASAPAANIGPPSHAAAAGTAPSDARWITLSLGEASVRAPAGWYTTPYRGELAPVYLPVRFLSTSRFTGPCATRNQNQSRCTTQNWFPSDWRTPADGVILLWSHAEFPTTAGPTLSHLPGTRTTIDHRPAKVWNGPATSSCPGGAATEMDAEVREAAHSYPGERFDLRACLGPEATPQTRATLTHSLKTLHIDE
jgi:hypothetical protein